MVVSKKMENKRFLFMMASVFLSCFFINLFIRKGFDFEYLHIDVYSINDSFKIEYLSMVSFVTLKRLKQFIILCILVNILNKDFVYNIIILLFGIALGIMLTVQTYYDGIVGIFLFILYIFPHYIVYFILLREICTNSYEGSNVKKYVIYLLLFFMGLLFETFFSRFFLYKFYQYMVLI